MAQLGGTFDASTVEPRTAFEALPPGDYLMVITKSAFEPNKAGTGSFLKLELQVVEGPRKGATLFDRLNLDNPNAQAVEIARATLSGICHAVGKLSVADSEELHNLPMLVKVVAKPRDDKPGEVSNEIKGYKPAGGSGAAAPNPPGAGAAAPSGPAWLRR